MGYATREQILQAANALTFRADQTIRRTKGLWHVFVFLRATALQNLDTLTLTSFGLTEACFDVLGIQLPIAMDSRNVYYEPAATMGSNMFRHREGPRQTILNRMQGGLSGGGNKPDLFTTDQIQLPITISLATNWISNLRAVDGNREVLDAQTTALITWLFRFGIPEVNGASAPIGDHQGNGVVDPRANVTLSPIPEDTTNLSSVLRDFLGLTSEQLQSLIPNLETVNCLEWQGAQSVPTSDLQSAMLNQFGPQQPIPVPTPGQPATMQAETPEESPVEADVEPDLQSSPADYSLNWDALAAAVIARLPAIPLVGLEGAALQCLAALRARKFVVILGPPGTGKTELATTICECALDCGMPAFTVATATADWSTFETIGGYMPSPQNANELVFSENVFVECVRTGRWLVIDELNRADIDKAFGELFTLFSGNRVRLSYKIEGRPIVLLPPGSDVNSELEYPIYQMPDWRMLGTMNTFDKASLYQMSYAFMRRFAFVETDLPEPDSFTQLLTDRATAQLAPPQCDEALRDESIGLLGSVFASDAEGTLRSLGAGVGPAIALDVINYLRERYALNVTLNVPSNAKSIVREALEMYLYPQFEGKNDLHGDILDSIAVALTLSTDQKLRTGRQLSNWTGVQLQGG